MSEQEVIKKSSSDEDEPDEEKDIHEQLDELDSARGFEAPALEPNWEATELPIESNFLRRMWIAMWRTPKAKVTSSIGIVFFIFLLALLIYGNLFLT